MRLVSFGPAGAERPGVLSEGRIVPLASLDASLPPSWRAVLAAGRLELVRELVASGRGQAIDPAEVRLGPPIPDPSKLVCIGLNYRDHALEQGKEPPETPLLFAKAPSALAGPTDPIRIPAELSQVDLEAELAFVIGRRARRVTRAEALAHVAGYMIFDDVSERALQRSERQWFRAKSFDSFAPSGPALVTPEEAGNPEDLRIGSELGGVRLQDSSTSQLVHGVAALVAYISASMTLEPGDIVATGTPAGVGVYRDPPAFLKPGDVARVWIEGLGELVNPIVADSCGLAG